MSGWSYLNGKLWAEVTRDERYYCQHFFNLLRDRDNLKKFIALLNSKSTIALDPDVEWEPAYEVCFYRDLWFLNKDTKDIKLISPKRTFDLCLFSEKTIVIIEAKAQQGFDSDISQFNMFKKDKCEVTKSTGARTLLVGLASSKHIDKLNGKYSEDFNCLVSWKDLTLELFKDDPVLLRADSLYEGGKSYAANSTEFMQGKELVTLPEDKIALYIVGRFSGAEGVRQDVKNNEWAERYYQVNTEVQTPPNRNWIKLRDFIELVKAGGA